jgi:hypothetical protein
MLSETGSILLAMATWKRFLIAAFAATLGACGADLDVKEPVTDREVMGLWVVSLDTLEILRRDGLVPSPMNPLYVNLHPNGSCGYFSVELVEGKPKSFLYSCTWQLRHDEKIGANAPTKNSILLLLPKNGGDFAHHLWLGRDGGKLFLWEHYGDPDNGERIDYVRNFVSNS